MSPEPTSGAPTDGAPLFVHYFTLDVFTDTRFGGNPLAVILDARGLSSEQMLQVTREFNYSESTFVLPAETAGTTKRVRIFTPGGEVPFAGHPTIGTAIALVFSGDAPTAGDRAHVVLGENVGPVPVTVRMADGVPVWAQLSVAQLPTEQPPMDRATVAAMLSVPESDILDTDGHAPTAVSCGLPFLIVPMVSREAVSRVQIDMPTFARTLRGTSCAMIMAFAPVHDVPGVDVHARVFCPDDGVPEDPATGSATAALGGYLAARTPRTGTLRWVSQQGLEMGRPSRLEIEVDKPDGVITAVRVGGSAVLMSEGRLRVQ
jgi:trans-2,3-dihydro-3-hydroxyanthranilate isomerase